MKNLNNNSVSNVCKYKNISDFHQPVLTKESLENLNIQKNSWYLDCTLGGGGHSQKILETGGKILAIDQDQEAVNYAKKKLNKFIKNKKLIIQKDNFSNLKKISEKYKIKPLGILFDLGVSSFQLAGNNRGFSFQLDEDLDMRMDPSSQTVTAADLLTGLYEDELAKLIKTYGEDPLYKQIAKNIVRLRRQESIKTTRQLSEIIARVYSKKYSKKSRTNPATRTFQALRIAVNDELNNLKTALKKSLDILAKNGRIAVISFHGLEDKIVKKYFLCWQEKNKGKIINKKPIIPSEKEIAKNPRSRSAKLRIFEKL